jgi:lipopolysaccharide export system ATP-binding protein
LLVLELAGVTGKPARERADKLLAEFGLGNVARQMGYSLSGGERRRVEIARALATEPSFILLDEPFTGVDPIAISDLQKIIVQLKDRGIGVLITDHSVREMFKSIDRGYIMYDGKIMAEGTPDEIRAHPAAREFYLGRDFEL